METAKLRAQYRRSLEGLKICLQRANERAPKKYNGATLAQWAETVASFQAIVDMSDARLIAFTHVNTRANKQGAIVDPRTFSQSLTPAFVIFKEGVTDLPICILTDKDFDVKAKREFYTSLGYTITDF